MRKLTLKRKFGIEIASFFYLTSCIDKEFEKLKDTVYAETQFINIQEFNLHSKMQKYMYSKFLNYKNSYIESVINNNLKLEVSIVGAEPELFKCKCCSYKSLLIESEYFICEVCYWEDDGSEDVNKFSSVNRLKLLDAINNFNQYGVCEKDYLEFVMPDRFLKFYKDDF